ncbi:hypothetical protein [Rhodohalobacter mucosus]|uniref:Uncharacterized protein n=1 Tax=Rhodohalobacter mucosus TaxID=2079485 RepID=A0A316TTU1_9BACT|nr:hypothetical protein [Rhodohalobacter mucosus]PWN05702.1 hypothetical protein DDZ15_14040 [Rhodohalobacter mucosus]
MKKLFIFICIFSLTNVSPLFGNFYICRITDDCAMFVIEDDEGYSWYIECYSDRSRDRGRTNGAIYDGDCELMTMEI